jgi:hypothetical protein
MIYGNVVDTVSYVDYYFIEMRFKDAKKVISYDHNFYTKEQFTTFLPDILLMERAWAIDIEHKAFTGFLGDFYFSFVEEAVLSRIAYIDSNSKFHFFELSKKYIETNHPELLL